MEVKIKNNNEMTDATIEMIDGVMIVSPKETETIDITQFKDGDVVACGCKNGDEEFTWLCILDGDIEHNGKDYLFMEEYASLDGNGEFELKGYSEGATWVRFATEEEKKKLFDKLAEEGLEWDAEKRELVKLKWKPKLDEKFYHPILRLSNGSLSFEPIIETYIDDMFNNIVVKNGWAFQTKEECQEFCYKLNWLQIK